MEQVFKNRVSRMFKLRYENLTKCDFDTFYINILEDLDAFNNASTKERSYKRLLSSIKLTKYRWVKKYISNKTTKEYTDISHAEYYYNKVLSDELSLDDFISFFNTPSLEDYKNNIFSDLYEWQHSDDLFLSDYKYIDSLSKKSINAAFKNDILKVYYNFTNENTTVITRIPSVLGNIPFDPTNKKDYFTVSEKKKIDESSSEFSLDGTIDKIISSPENNNELIMKLEKKTYLRIEEGKETQDLITQIALIKAAKAFNNLDLKIISYYYTNFYNLVSDQSIDNYISDIVNKLGIADSKKNYKAVEDSLNKIGSIKLESPNYEGRSLKGSILDVFFNIKNGRTEVKVYLGGFLKNLMLMDSSLSFNKDIYDKLSAASQQLAIWLQNRRLKNVISQGTFTDIITIDEIADALLITAKSIYKRRDTVLPILKELQSFNLIIDSFEYEKKGYKVFIKYSKLPADILKKIENNQFKPGELIEGFEYAVSK